LSLTLINFLSLKKHQNKANNINVIYSAVYLKNFLKKSKSKVPIDTFAFLQQFIDIQSGNFSRRVRPEVLIKDLIAWSDRARPTKILIHGQT